MRPSCLRAEFAACRGSHRVTASGMCMTVQWPHSVNLDVPHAPATCCQELTRLNTLPLVNLALAEGVRNRTLSNTSWTRRARSLKPATEGLSFRLGILATLWLASAGGQGVGALFGIPICCDIFGLTRDVMAQQRQQSGQRNM